MTAEWFDLGLRLRAAATAAVAPRLVHAPARPGPRPVAVRAHRHGDQIRVTAATPGTAPRTGTGPDALALLGDLGVTLAAPGPATLVTDQPNALDLLWRLALTAPEGGRADETAGHIAWWRERADFPGGRAVLDLPSACRTRWVTGHAPQAESAPALWRAWLGVTRDDAPGMLELASRIAYGPALPWLSDLASDDVYAYLDLRREYNDGLHWRRPDTPARAAIGLRARCDAADLYAAALLTDPLYRDRGVHSGHVVTGRADPTPGPNPGHRVRCERMDGRLRAGTAVVGWAGTATDNRVSFTALVSAADLDHGHLMLTLTRTTGPTPAPGATVTMHPAPPSPARQRAGRKAMGALYRTRRSWLATGRTPTTTRRDVPLDVLIAGAEPDEP